MENKDIATIIVIMTIMSALLPSIVTQVNWLYPGGLAPHNVRIAVLIISWIAVIILALALYRKLKGA